MDINENYCAEDRMEKRVEIFFTIRPLQGISLSAPTAIGHFAVCLRWLNDQSRNNTVVDAEIERTSVDTTNLLQGSIKNFRNIYVGTFKISKCN